VSGLNVLVLPSWYATPAHPLAGVFVRDQARAVARRNRVVVLFCEGPSAGVRRLLALRDEVQDGLRTVRVRHRPSSLPHAPATLMLLSLVAGALRLRREGFRPDVIHAHTLSAGVAALVLGRMLGAPVVISEHWSRFALGTLTPWERTVARIAFQRADLVCPVSERLRAAIEPYAPRARFRVVPNVVDTQAFAADGEARASHEGPARLLTVSLLTDKKGVDRLLDALVLLRADGAGPLALDVAGDGPARPALVERARALGLDGAVRFHGLQPRAEVARLMRGADLFVLPSVVETFGVALVEALASGLPVVATEVGIAPEVVDEHTGVLVRPGDPAALADGIRDALSRLDDYDAAAAASLAETRFGPDAVGRVWDEVYGSLR
jgi:glycosyltransferase involved in cell wall biosynthesis